MGELHDPLCRGYYQRYTDPRNCASCDLIWAVREDDKQRYAVNIGKLEAAFLQGREYGLNQATSAIENMPKEDGGYCFVVHHCEVLEEIDLLRRSNERT